MKTNLMKPCYLVSLKSSINGGISYKRIDLDRFQEDATDTAKWETTRIIQDKAEYEHAVKTRGRAVNEIRRVCNITGFGLTCPLSKETELDEAIATARRLVTEEHNADAACTQISIHIMKGQISTTDQEAVKSLADEVATLISDMQSGIDRLNATDIREAANKARQLLGIMEEEQSNMLVEAITQARQAARAIVQRVEKKGEAAEVVIADIKRNNLDKARAAFLDYGENSAIGEATPTVQVQRFVELDVEKEVAVKEVA